MKIAIVHDELVRKGGAEQVTRCFHMAFPEAPIFTLAYNPDTTYTYFKNCQIRTSWFQNIAHDEKRLKQLFFPLGIIAMQQLDVTAYDVVLMSSTYCAKYVKISPNAIVINYCHQPFRLAWYPDSYKEFIISKGIKKWLLQRVVSILQKVDYNAAKRTDYFIANTKETALKIRKIYNYKNDIPVIKPPVNCANFHVSSEVKDYYLVVARLEYYKKVDLVIDAFNELGYPLIIIGKGSKEQELKKYSKNNISFRNNLSTEELRNLYTDCKAFIFPQLEDYGITPLEANASGRPVIAYGEGGVKETMIPYTGDFSKATAIFFPEQTKESLITAIKLFERLPAFNSNFIREHAETFDESAFIEVIKKFVSDKTLKLATNTI